MAEASTSEVAFTTLMFVRRGQPTDWLPAVLRTLAVPGSGDITVAVRPGLGSAEDLEVDDRVSVVVTDSFAAALTAEAESGSLPLLVMSDPTLLPQSGIGPSIKALHEDARVATVSFLCNSAGYLSFPYRDHATQFAITGYDETTLSRRLRESSPSVRATPIAIPSGAANLVARHAVVMVGGPHPEFDLEPEVSVIDLALRAQRRGLTSVLDSTTFVNRPWEIAPWGTELTQGDSVRRLLHKHHHFFPGLFDVQRFDRDSPLESAMNVARAKVDGLRIAIDASCIGPIENGTQVQTLALARALAQRDDVHSVVLGIPGELPGYATDYVSEPKIQVLRTPDLSFEGLEQVDIVHRPFQPGTDLPWQKWRGLSERVLVTVQDLIAYGVGAYHFDAPDWLTYRKHLARACRKADGVVVISHDVHAQMLAEQLPVESTRLFVVENGTDHLSGEELTQIPREFVEQGWAAQRFMVVLGADYSHKNRDLALRMWHELQERGHDIELVLAGVAVAQGSSRVSEAKAVVAGGAPLTLSDVSAQERNWLLRHAELCLYPSAAEGFGLVPFEAARFGTPTVHAGFGPLSEVMPESPVVAASWTPTDLADAAERLLTDPGLAKAQIKSVLASAERYRWDRTAAGLVEAYRDLIARPRH